MSPGDIRKAQELLDAIKAHATATDYFTFEPVLPRLTIVGVPRGDASGIVEVMGGPCNWLRRTARGPWIDGASCDAAVREAFADAREPRS